MQVSPQILAALELLDYFGIAVFAVSGALLAAEKRPRQAARGVKKMLAGA